jgi:hypothetical protein
MAMCFECGKVIGNSPSTTRDYHGARVTLHKACNTRMAKRHVTARATTCETGETYADEGDRSPFRTVFVREGMRDE